MFEEKTIFKLGISPGEKNILRINISSVIKILTIITVLLIILSVATNIFYYTYNDYGYFAFLFNLDKEANIPTRFASELLLIASFLFFVIYRIKSRNEREYLINWLLLSIIFLMMALDESVQLHEQTSQFVKGYVKDFHFAWVIPGSIFVLIFAVGYIKFFLSFNYRWKKLFFLSAFVYLAGALGMEVVGNFYQDAAGQDNLQYVLITNIEETLEFAGVILLIYTLFSYLQSLSSSFKIDISSGQKLKSEIPVTDIQQLNREN